MTAPLRIALLFALPQEYTALKRLTAPWKRTRREPFKSFVRQAPPQELLLIESGMGHERMLEALEWLLGWTRPDLVIAAGFAGSLAQDLVVGDVCLGGRFIYCDLQPQSQPRPTINLKVSERLAHFCAEHRIRQAQIVTVNQPEPKPRLARVFRETPSIMDMESYFAGQWCYQNQIPFLSFRAISDGLYDEIDFDLETISDSLGRVQIPLVVASVLKNPQLFRSFYRSWKRSAKAAKNLGRALAGLLNLSSSELHTLIGENRLFV
jgi:adenosylhomocysteine nucleosidase